MISNLMISRSDTNFVGLFRYTSSGVDIANVGLLNIDITGGSRVGGLVGSNLSMGEITGSYATGDVEASINKE